MYIPLFLILPFYIYNGEKDVSIINYRHQLYFGMFFISCFRLSHATNWVQRINSYSVKHLMFKHVDIFELQQYLFVVSCRYVCCFNWLALSRLIVNWRQPTSNRLALIFGLLNSGTLYFPVFNFTLFRQPLRSMRSADCIGRRSICSPGAYY